MKLARAVLLASMLSVALAMPALTATAAAPTSSGASVNAKASACPDAIRLSGKRFAFYKRRVSCAGARRAVRRLYASSGRRGTPRGFRCRSSSKFKDAGGCANRTGTRYFGFSG